MMQTLFILSLFAIAGTLYLLALRQNNGSRTGWVFLIFQGIAVLGLFFLLGKADSGVRFDQFFLMVIITLVTTYALYVSSNPVPVSKTVAPENATA
jgi:hypothetical protein